MATIKKVGDNRWQVRVFLGRRNGKTLRHTKVIHGLKRDAETYARDKEAARDLGKMDAEVEQITLVKWMNRWLESKKDNIREKTYESYELIVRNHINKAKFAGKYLPQIKPIHIQDLYDEMTENYSPRTINYVHTLLSSALERAVGLDFIPKNPCKFTTRPVLKRMPFKVFDIEQSQRFLEFAKKDKYHVLFVIALTLGLRPEEYQALQWSDFDTVGKTLRIERTYYENRKEAYWKFMPCKTENSKRTLKLSQYHCDYLEQQREKVKQLKTDQKQYFTDYDLIFPSDSGSPMRLNNLTKRHFHEILKDAELGIDRRIYSLRHACATLLLAKGEKVKVVSEILGHKSVAFTMDTYQHVLDSMRESAVENIESIFFKIPEKKESEGQEETKAGAAEKETLVELEVAQLAA